VSVCGVPEPNKDHFIIMVKYAWHCLKTFQTLVYDLQAQLGPDTADLQMRFGLHSGPVTAGVLRGQKSRFQLFGDTVNTAARMESCGQPGKIQLSQETAGLLTCAGKAHWLQSREGLVQAKGKGALQTYWLKNSFSDGPKSTHTDSDAMDAFEGEVSSDETSSFAGLITWSTEILVCLVRQIMIRRNATAKKEIEKISYHKFEYNSIDHMVLDEVQEVVELPVFNPSVSAVDTESVVLSDLLREEIYEFVSVVCSLYRGKSFQRLSRFFETTQLSNLLLGCRIVCPTGRQSFSQF
jgi:hypothetical protein